MQPDTDALLTNLFEEAPPREFVTAMRGYDRNQVDEHIRQIEAEVRRHREQAQVIQRERSEPRAQSHRRARPAYTGLGARIEQLLRLAEEQATEVVQTARSEAGEIKATAKTDAAELRASAENDAHELGAHAKREAAEHEPAAEREVDSIRPPARREPAELTSATEREAATVRATADHE